MAVIQVDTAEFNDVVDVLQERGVEVCYSVEPDEVYLYGSADTIQQVDDILWAAQVMPFGADEAGYLAIPCQRNGIMGDNPA